MPKQLSIELDRIRRVTTDRNTHEVNHYFLKITIMRFEGDPVWG